MRHGKCPPRRQVLLTVLADHRRTPGRVHAGTGAQLAAGTRRPPPAPEAGSQDRAPLREPPAATWRLSRAREAPPRRSSPLSRERRGRSRLCREWPRRGSPGRGSPGRGMAAPGCEEARAGGLAPGAGPSPTGVARRRGRTLLVRHLPAELTAAEKEELLRHFGAAAVRVLADHGRLVRARGPGVGGGQGGAGGAPGPRSLGFEARPASLLWFLPCEGKGGGEARLGRRGQAVTRLCPFSSCLVFLFATLQQCRCIYQARLFARTLVRSPDERSLRLPSLPRFRL